MTDDTPRRRARASALLAVLATVAASLALTGPASAADHGDRVPKVADLGPTSFSTKGPFAVGETTLTLPTNSAPVEVWYPAKRADVAGRKIASYDVVDWLPDFLKSLVPKGESVTYPSGGVRGVPVARGRFPLVVFSHGYAGFRDQSTFLTAWLASWGFVVAAPDHHSRDLTKVLGGQTGTTTDVADLRATITLMSARNKAPGRFQGHLDTRRIGAVGHSAGGSAVEQLAVADKRVTTFVGLAGASAGALTDDGSGAQSKVPHQPGLLMAGTSDGIVSSDRMRSAYNQLRAPKRFVLVGGGHHAFSDLCEIGSDKGGLLAVADLLGIPVPDQLKRLATDGCEPPALAPTEAWPAIRQTVVAHLRHVFRFDRSTAGLRGLPTAFPGVVAGSHVAR